jgi:hypothetical protein
MKRIFKLINKYARIGISVLVRLFLGLAYLVLLFPFAVVVRLCFDYLEIKAKSPRWIPLERIENEQELLTHQ